METDELLELAVHIADEFLSRRSCESVPASEPGIFDAVSAGKSESVWLPVDSAFVQTTRKSRWTSLA